MGSGTVLVVAALTTLLVAVGHVDVQTPGTPAPRWEVGVSPGVVVPALRGTAMSSYTPGLVGHPEATGTAGQSLVVDGGRASSLGLTVGRRVDEPWGLEVDPSYFAPALGVHVAY